MSGQFNKHGAMGKHGWNGILFEGLELRRLMAGDVAVHVGKGELFLTGDDAANAVVIERGAVLSDRTTFLVTPTDGTTVNGSADPFVVEGVRGMILNLGGGDDALTLDNVRLFGTATIDAGDGDDIVLVRSSRITGHLTITGGAGVDTLAVRKSTVQRDLTLDGGPSKDRFHLWQLDVQNRLALSDTHGVSLIDLSKLTVDGPSYVRSGDSMDFVNVDVSTFNATAVFTTRGQDDRVKVRGTVFHDESPVIGGAGDNAVDREVILSWDFRDGEQEWGAGFSEYPSAPSVEFDGQGNSTGFPTEQTYRLQSGLRSLPEDVNVPGAGFLLSGRNLSDDLFMYLHRAISVREGIVPGTAYDVAFAIKFASHVPAGLIGAGGAPAEAVYLKAGAAPRKPKNFIPGIETDTDEDFALNIKKGNQSSSGSEVSVAGNIANGGPFGVNDRVYRVVTRDHTHPEPIQSNGQGTMWLIVGTDSGFEGITTLYYMSIGVKLTPVEQPMVIGF